jgi:hypothetical protein
MRQLILLITALCSIHFVHSQIDSGVLEFGVYRTWVIENHPLSIMITKPTIKTGMAVFIFQLGTV